MLGLPGALVLAAFHYLPMLGSVIAFQDYQPYLGIGDSEWVGLENFFFLTENDPEFVNALINTLQLTVIQTVPVFPVPLALALLRNSPAGERLKRLLQSVLYLPHSLSWVIVVAIFQQMLGNAGTLNTFLVRNDLPTVEVIGTPELFMTLITTQSIWKDAGWGTIVFLAALSRIEPMALTSLTIVAVASCLGVRERRKIDAGTLAAYQPCWSTSAPWRPSRASSSDRPPTPSPWSCWCWAPASSPVS